jgi:hypothetical protein
MLWLIHATEQPGPRTTSVIGPIVVEPWDRESGSVCVEAGAVAPHAPRADVVDVQEVAVLAAVVGEVLLHGHARVAHRLDRVGVGVAEVVAAADRAEIERRPALAPARAQLAVAVLDRGEHPQRAARRGHVRAARHARRGRRTARAGARHGAQRQCDGAAEEGRSPDPHDRTNDPEREMLRGLSRV